MLLASPQVTTCFEKCVRFRFSWWRERYLKSRCLRLSVTLLNGLERKRKILHAAKHEWKDTFRYKKDLLLIKKCLSKSLMSYSCKTPRPRPRIEFKVSRHLAAPPTQCATAISSHTADLALLCLYPSLSACRSFSRRPASKPSTARTTPTTSSPPTLTSPTLSVHPSAGNHVVPGRLPREWVAVPALHMLHPRIDHEFIAI